MLDLAALKTKLTTDPAYVGKTVDEMVDLINTEKSQSPPMYRFILSKSDFMTMISPAVTRLASLDAAKQAKWSPLMTFLLQTPGAPVNLAKVTSLLSDAVVDGLLTAGEALAIQNSAKIEILTSDARAFGFAYIGPDDIQAALDSGV